MDGVHDGDVVMRGTTGGPGRIIIAGALGLVGCTAVLGVPDPDDLVLKECQIDVDCQEEGRVCCGDRNNGDFYQITCQGHCNDVTMCDSPGPDPKCPLLTCQSGQQVQSTCKVSTLLPPGYHVCECP